MPKEWLIFKVVIGYILGFTLSFAQVLMPLYYKLNVTVWVLNKPLALLVTKQIAFFVLF